MPYKVDMGCNGNIMPFNVFTKLFPNTIADGLVTTKHTTVLRTYNSTTIKHLGRCSVVIENNNKHKNASSL